MGRGEALEAWFVKNVLSKLDEVRIWAGAFLLAVAGILFFFRDPFSEFFRWVSFDILPVALAMGVARGLALLALLVGCVILIAGVRRLMPQARAESEREQARRIREAMLAVPPPEAPPPGPPAAPLAAPAPLPDELAHAKPPEVDAADRVLVTMFKLINTAYVYSIPALYTRWADALPSPLKGIVKNNIKSRVNNINKQYRRVRTLFDREGATRQAMYELYDLTTLEAVS